MARMLFVGVVLLLVGRLALLELRVSALLSALAEARQWPCHELKADPIIGVRDYGQRLQRAVRLIDECENRR